MKTKILVVLVVLLLGAFCFLPVATQAQEQKAQLYYVYDFVVKPAMVSQFEAGVKQEIELGSPVAWAAFSTNDLHYYFLTPIQNYAGIDSMEKADNEWSAKIGKEKSDALMKGYEGTFEYYKTGVIRSLPGLSYIPKAPKYKPEEENFVSWGFASVEFGKGEEFSSICKQYIALYDSAKIPVGWRMYVGLMGMEMPFYFWAETARSAAEYYADGEKVTKTVGETKSTELWNKTMAVCKKYESKIGRPRPDLSNKPKGK